MIISVKWNNKNSSFKIGEYTNKSNKRTPTYAKAHNN